MHIINGCEKKLAPGTLCFIRPSDEHCFRFTHRTMMVNIAFDEETFSALDFFLNGAFPFKEASESDEPYSVLLSGDDVSYICLKTKRLASEKEGGDAFLRAEMRLLLAEIFTRFFTNFTQDKKTKAPLWLVFACEKMREKDNFTEGMSAFLRLCGKSYEHADRCLKKYYGVTASEMINSLRINYAKNMIINSSLSISDICYDSGFSNLSWFYTLFKQSLGMTPGAFRKRYGSEEILCGDVQLAER